MKLLLHTCCAPCSVYCIKRLRQENIEPVVYWYNPNIHPYTEYKARRDCLKEYTKSIGIKAIFEENYGIREFCENVSNDIANRCKNYCYRVRLEQTAKYAKENGYDAFTTTLLVSIYQNHEAIKEIAEEMAEKYGVKFLYIDFREGFRKGQEEARQIGLYMQKYCGCIFSEESKYFEKIKKDEEKSSIENKNIEKEIKLDFAFPGLEIKKHKNGNREEIEFIYNLKKKEYIQEGLTEENKRNIFSRYMKENSKNIQIIYLNKEKIGYYISDSIIKEKIYLVEKYKNQGIEKIIEI